MLFHWISGIYGLFFSYQKRRFQKLLLSFGDQIYLEDVESAADIGYGTGALCSVLAELGINTTGVDSAKGMLKVARRKTRRLQTHLFLQMEYRACRFLINQLI